MLSRELNMPLKLESPAESVGNSQSQLLQAIRFRIASPSSADFDFYEQFARPAASETVGENRSEVDPSPESAPEGESDAESAPKAEDDATQPLDPTDALSEQVREIAISNQQPQIQTQPKPAKDPPSDPTWKPRESKRPEDESGESFLIPTARVDEDKPRLAVASLMTTAHPRDVKNVRSESRPQTQAVPNTHSTLQAVEVQRVAKDAVLVSAPSKTRKEPESEVADGKNSEAVRVKRRSDRSASRSRSNNDGARESTDRPQAADKPDSPRTGAVSTTAHRELAAGQSADPSSSHRDIASMAPASATTGVVNSPTYGSTGASASAAVAKSSASASFPLRSGSQASRSESISQATASAPASIPIAPQASGTRSVSDSRGATGSRLTQYQETKLVQRVLRGMEQLANGGGQVRMRLHPPELGSLQMSLRIEGNAVFAEMHVETTTARDTLMKNLPILRERLAEQGMQVQQFDVQADFNTDGGYFNANSSNGYGGSDSNSERQSSRHLAELQNRLPAPSSSAGSEPIRRWTRTHGQLDFEA